MFDRSTVSKILEGFAGNTFIGLTTETIPKLKGGKKNDMLGRIIKRTVSTVQIFTNQNVNAYANKRNRNRAKAGETTPFVLSPRAWGERVAGSAFVTHKGKDYLEVIFIDTKSVEYFLDGVSIDKANIEGLPASRPSSDTDDVIIRTYALESIHEIRAFGGEFTT